MVRKSDDGDLIILWCMSVYFIGIFCFALCLIWGGGSVAVIFGVCLICLLYL